MARIQEENKNTGDNYTILNLFLEQSGLSQQALNALINNFEIQKTNDLVQEKAEEMYPGLFKPIMLTESRYNQHTGKYASIIGIVGCIVRCIFPDNVPVALIFGSVVMYATIPLISVLPAMVLNTAEVNMKNYGVRITGMTNASNSFVGKIGSGVGSAAMGWVLAAGGFDAVAAGGAITESVKTAVYALNIYIPLAMFVIMLIILAKYDLEDKLDPIFTPKRNRRVRGE